MPKSEQQKSAPKPADIALGSRLGDATRQFSNAEIAEIAGVSVNTVVRWKNGRVSADPHALAKIASKSGVALLWLVTGEPPMRPNDSPFGPSVAGAEAKIGEVRVPIINVTASAGDGLGVDDERSVDYLTFSLTRLLELGSPEHMEIIAVEGDSMEPELRSGDHVMVDKSQVRLADGLYAVSVNDHLFVKRVRVKGKLKADLVSANPAYPPFEITIADPKDGDDIQQDGALIIGRVVWSGRAL